MSVNTAAVPPFQQLRISPVVFGAMWRRLHANEAQRIRCVHQALDLGISSIDTAPLYDFGGSERILGRALMGRHGEVQILTKVGLRWDTDHGQALFRAPIDGALRTVRKDSRPHSVRRDVEASLERLRCECLTLVQVHQYDDQTPVADTMGELLRLRAEGKLQYIGVSNYQPAQLRAASAALGDVALVSTQNHYSLLHRDIEAGVLPCARELGVGLLCYSPLEAGLLAGRLLDVPACDWPDRGPMSAPKNVRAIHRVLGEVAWPMAERLGIPLSALALRWLLTQPGVQSVICGASDGEQLRANRLAAEAVLDARDAQVLREAFEQLRLSRYAHLSFRERSRFLVGRVARAGLKRIGRDSN